MKTIVLFLVLYHLTGFRPPTPGLWGFQPHKLINRQAIFTLPPAMVTFYKYHMHYLSEEAVTADHRRYVVATEAPRHYIDLDYYGTDVDKQWKQFVITFPMDSIQEHGLLPWHLISLKPQLVQAFKDLDTDGILRLSADAGHYLADAHVPLHTSINYNGQLTGQNGIHGFWETRVPELLFSEFNLWTGKAGYREHWDQIIWKIVMESHQAVDSVLFYEKMLTETFSEDRKYSFEVRLTSLVKVFSQEFTRAYHVALNNQVERRMRAAIMAIGNFWYSCWVDAGQPELSRLIENYTPYSADYQSNMDSVWRSQHPLRK